MNRTADRAVKMAHLALCIAIGCCLAVAVSAARPLPLLAALACLAADLGLVALSAHLRGRPGP